MIREIYLRDPYDPRFNSKTLEINDPLEALLSKVRMIIYTTRGEVLGEPHMGLNLEEKLFEFIVDEGEIRSDFYAQVAKYIPESRDYKIEIGISTKTDGVKNSIFLEISVNDIKYLGIIA